MRFCVNIPEMINFMKLKLQIKRWIWFWNFRFLLGFILKTYFPKTDLLLGLYSLSLTLDNSSFNITLWNERNKTIGIKSLMAPWAHIFTSQYLSYCMFFWICLLANKNVVNQYSPWHNNFIAYLFLIKNKIIKSKQKIN